MISDQEIAKLRENPQLFAIRMNDHDLESLIVAFVETKLARDNARRKDA